MNKPTCKVHGMIRPGAMCSKVIVGGKYCGFSGDCQFKSCADMIVAKVQADAEESGVATKQAEGANQGDEGEKNAN